MIYALLLSHRSLNDPGSYHKSLFKYWYFDHCHFDHCHFDHCHPSNIQVNRTHIGLQEKADKN